VCDWKTALDGDKGVEGYHSHTASPRLFADVNPQNEVQITKLLALQRTTHRHTRVYIKVLEQADSASLAVVDLPCSLTLQAAQAKKARRQNHVAGRRSCQIWKKLCTRSVRRPEKDKGETQFHIRFFLFLLAVISLK